MNCPRFEVTESCAIGRPSAAFQSFSERRDNPAFGHLFTDHMATARFDAARGWFEQRIGPLAPFELHPASSVFHYAQEIFEGLKAYRSQQGAVQLFRPLDHAQRFVSSARRISMPELPPDLFVAGLDALLRQDEPWVPASPGNLYVRPFMIACDPLLGARTATQYQFAIIACPVGNTGPQQSAPLRVWASPTVPRAVSGGTGAAKCGGNYAACLIAQNEARARGCDQVVFLDGIERRWVEELGSMNIFFVFDDGSLQTPPLNGNILPGITRDSLITLARDAGRTVRESPYSLEDWRRDAATGHLVEVFACGTAAGVVSIGTLVTVEGEIPIGARSEGALARRLREELHAIQQGSAPDRHHWIRRLGQ